MLTPGKSVLGGNRHGHRPHCFADGRPQSDQDQKADQAQHRNAIKGRGITAKMVVSISGSDRSLWSRKWCRRPENSDDRSIGFVAEVVGGQSPDAGKIAPNPTPIRIALTQRPAGPAAFNKKSRPAPNISEATAQMRRGSMWSPTVATTTLPINDAASITDKENAASPGVYPRSFK